MTMTTMWRTRTGLASTYHMPRGNSAGYTGKRREEKKGGKGLELGWRGFERRNGHRIFEFNAKMLLKGGGAVDGEREREIVIVPLSLSPFSLFLWGVASGDHPGGLSLDAFESGTTLVGRLE